MKRASSSVIGGGGMDQILRPRAKHVKKIVLQN